MRSFLRVSTHIAALMLLASCSPIVDQRGHSEEQADYSQIIPGQTRSEDVQALLGSPSATSAFGDKVWYYISEKKETVGMFAPEIVEQSVVAVHFNADDTVSDITRTEQKDGKRVEYVEKQTPTEGRKMTVMEQLLGNFGKFATPGRDIDPRNLGR